MNSIKVLTALIVAFLLSSCASQQGLRPIDREGSELRNYMGLFVFELPQGQEWYEMGSNSGTIAFGKKLESNEHTFIASAHISEFTTKFLVPEDFLAFVKKARMEDTNTDRFKIIQYDENLDKTRSEYCTKYALKAEDKGKGILESHGFSCLHPTHPELGITIEYSERTKGPHVSELVRKEGERFINSLELIE